MTYLKISNVSKNYLVGDNTYQALKNINLEFNKNEFVAIIGESGCGKSTLLNLIAGISDITLGNIYFNGENIKNFSNKRMNYYRKKDIGIIFQKYNLIDAYNIYDNIDLINENKISKNKIINLLDKLGVKNKYKNKISQCSGGEIQRVSALRAIINEPSILLCDEPTGALDKDNSEILMNYLDSIKENKLIIFITHSKELANRYASRIIELKDGEVIKDYSLNNKKIHVDKELTKYSKYKIKTKHKFYFLYNIIKKKKGRFLISLISSIFLLFFISISFMAINVTNEYVNYSFLSSLDANIINIKSYKKEKLEIVEQPLPILIKSQLSNNDRFDIRKNYDNYLNNKLLNNIEFKTNNKKVNLTNIRFSLTSNYSSKDLKMGKYPILNNEVIINENLYNYFKSETNVIINKKIKILDDSIPLEYLKIKGVVSNALMNTSLVIYFDYNFMDELLKNTEINEYQLDVKNINEINNIINELKASKFYQEKENINNNLNYSFTYSSDLENYNTFYDLIKLAKIVIYFFLLLSLIISIMLLSNVIYSFNEEEKRNYSLLRILGFSNFDISIIPLFLSIIISIISFIIIIYINYKIDVYVTDYLIELININISLTLSYKEYLLMFIIILLLSIISSIFPLMKLKFIKLDDALKEE